MRPIAQRWNIGDTRRQDDYWATVAVIDQAGGLPFYIESGYEHKTAEDAVTTLFNVYTEWLELK